MEGWIGTQGGVRLQWGLTARDAIPQGNAERRAKKHAAAGVNPSAAAKKKSRNKFLILNTVNRFIGIGIIWHLPVTLATKLGI